VMVLKAAVADSIHNKTGQTAGVAYREVTGTLCRKILPEGRAGSNSKYCQFL
jgi:hypothetical protein